MNADPKPEKNMTRLWLIAGGIVLVIALVVLLMSIGSKDDALPEVKVHEITPTETRIEATGEYIPKLFLMSRNESDESVEIKTSYCTMKYPIAYADLVEAVVVDANSKKVVEFYARLNGGHYLLYTISFTETEGELIGTLELEGSEEPLELRAIFHEASEELVGDDLISFRAGQETFNDVWTSLAENTRFTPAA